MQRVEDLFCVLIFFGGIGMAIYTAVQRSRQYGTSVIAELFSRVRGRRPSGSAGDPRLSVRRPPGAADQPAPGEIWRADTANPDDDFSVRPVLVLRAGVDFVDALLISDEDPGDEFGDRDGYLAMPTGAWRQPTDTDDAEPPDSWLDLGRVVRLAPDRCQEWLDNCDYYTWWMVLRQHEAGWYQDA